MTPGFRQLLNRYAMLGFERQLALFDLLGDDDWRLSPKEGTVTFGKRVVPVQFLGTRADADNTWLWAWANEAGALPATALEAAKKVKQVGKKRSIGELAVESLPLDNFEFDAHTLALVATQVAGLPAYYRFPYAGGAVFAALELPEAEFPVADVQRMAHVVREVAERFDLDHKIAFTSYCEARGAKVASGKDEGRARFPDGSELIVRFDDAGRITEVGAPRAVSSRGSAARP